MNFMTWSTGVATTIDETLSMLSETMPEVAPMLQTPTRRLTSSPMPTESEMCVGRIFISSSFP